MSQYYLPYNFVPVTGEVNGDKVKTIDWKNQVAPNKTPAIKAARTDIFERDRCTGTLTCNVTTKSPVFVGNEHIKGTTDYDPTKLQNYLVDGQPALPGNSLRGMIASIAETISQSTLRVLDNENWKFFEKTKFEDELLDLSPFNINKEYLTPAELIFGEVSLNEDKFGKKAAKTHHRAFKSRVFFSDATLTHSETHDILSDEIEMQAPGGPKLVNGKDQKDHKLNVPSTYFSQKYYPYDGSAFDVKEYGIPKQIIQDLKPDSDVNGILPNGRKRYLLHTQSNYQNLKQAVQRKKPRREKNIIQFRPIKEKTEFRFTIKFQNLTREELGLLLRSIIPSADFRHSLGLNKNRGFGQILISIESLFLKNMTKSYSHLGGCIYEKVEPEFPENLVDLKSLEILKAFGRFPKDNVRWRRGIGRGSTPPEGAFCLARPTTEFLPYQDSSGTQNYSKIIEKIKSKKKTNSSAHLQGLSESGNDLISALGRIPKLKNKLNRQLGVGEATDITNYLRTIKGHPDYQTITAGLKEEITKGKDCKLLSPSAIKKLRKSPHLM